MNNEDLPEEVTVGQTGGWSSQLCNQGRDDFQAEETAGGKTLGQEWVWQPEQLVSRGKGGEGAGKMEQGLGGHGKGLRFHSKCSERTSENPCRKVTWLDECFENITSSAV